MWLLISNSACFPERSEYHFGLDEIPDSFRQFPRDQGYRGPCTVTDQGRVVYSGEVRLKRRLNPGWREGLVLLVMGQDLERLSPEALAEIDPDRMSPYADKGQGQ